MKSISRNKYAYFNYEILETIEGGIILLGHEVKAIKFGRVNIQEATIKIIKQELWVTNMDIPLYTKTAPNTVPNYYAKRPRKILVTRKQMAHISERINKTGLVMIILEIIETKNKLIKLKLGLGKLKKKIDKKQIIKERDLIKQAAQDVKRYFNN